MSCTSGRRLEQKIDFFVLRRAPGGEIDCLVPRSHLEGKLIVLYLGSKSVDFPLCGFSEYKNEGDKSAREHTVILPSRHRNDYWYVSRSIRRMSWGR